MQRSELCAYTSDQRHVMAYRFKTRTTPIYDLPLYRCLFCGDLYRRPVRSECSLRVGTCSAICTRSLNEGLPSATIPGYSYQDIAS